MSLNLMLVEDHYSLRKVTASVLREAGFVVIDVAHAEDVDAELVNHRIDIFILDINLLGEDGLSLARRLREAYSNTGIIMFTARSASNEVAEGYNAGADIYLTKPVATTVLVSAVESLGRRLGHAASQVALLTLNIQTLELRYKDLSVKLQNAEANVLSAFARSAKHTLESGEIAVLFGMDEEDYSKSALEVRVARLRKKLRQVSAEADIQSVRLLGYRLTQAIQVVN